MSPRGSPEFITSAVSICVTRTREVLAQPSFIVPDQISAMAISARNVEARVHTPLTTGIISVAQHWLA